MSRIKAKIIGNLVWTTENLSRAEYQLITGKYLPVKNDQWLEYYGPKCFAYNSAVKNKKEYLFDLNALAYLREYATHWRIPDTRDLDCLFRTIDSMSHYGRETVKLAQDMRGTYGWRNNGVNKVGFNAYPNPTLDENGLREFEISRWWYFNDQRASFDGFSVYEDDTLAISGPFAENAGLAIRLVMDLTDPRVEENVYYV
jgi:uncharacterized protein (TIGR02145 family)